ncbi:exopolyphosphatase [Dellaglioa sp. P0083]|uniref:Ppx/GppA phosphatase family protein n=1 Tax=Dellaglioa kimchii TaxID=3344667 RepID=UPI0038D399E4
MEKFVLLDLGSNSVRLSINEQLDNGQFKEIKRLKSETRLSEGMGKSRVLQEHAMARTIEALVSFKKQYDIYGPVAVHGIATAAVRMARNQKEFLHRIKEAVGADIEVLSGDDEAYYDYMGVMEALPIHDCLILDTGGASSELIHVVNRKVVHLVSLPFGAVTLSEKYLKNEQITSKELFQLMEYLVTAFQKLEWLKEAIELPLVLLGGSNRIIGRLNRKKQKLINTEAINGYQLSRKAVSLTFEDLVGLTTKKRAQVSGIASNRADIIVGGIAPVVVLGQYLNSVGVIFSESGVREGYLTTKLGK